jgi:hypothetical protein
MALKGNFGLHGFVSQFREDILDPWLRFLIGVDVLEPLGSFGKFEPSFLEPPLTHLAFADTQEPHGSQSFVSLRLSPRKSRLRKYSILLEPVS